MSRRKRALGILGAAIVATGLASCDSGTSSTVSINYPKVKFVGNDTCPTTVQVTPGASPTPQQPSPYLPSPPQVNGDHIVGQAIDEMPHFHVDPSLKVQYNHDPPTSGCHYSIANQAPVPPGAYNQEIPAEYWVHNLEHGYVVVWYDSKTAASDVATLQSLATTLPRLLVVGWWQGDLPADKHVVLTSWGRTDRCAKVSDDVINSFYKAHLNDQKLAPEAGLPAIQGADQYPPSTLPGSSPAPSPSASTTASPSPSSTKK